MALKALTIFQLGDIPVRLYMEDYQGYNSDFDVEVVTVAAGRRAYFGSKTRVPKPRKFKLKGAVLATSYRSLDQQLNELNAIAGGEIDVIAYTFNDCCGELDCTGGCGNPNDGDLTWLHTRGVITGTDLDDKNGQGQISVDLTCQSEWQPLNRLLWHYGERNAPDKRHTLQTPVFRDLGRLPTWKVVEALEKGCISQIFWQRQYSDALVMYDSEVWAALHSYLRPSYIKTGYGHTWREAEVDAHALNRRILRDALHVDASQWSAEPSSLYAFRALPRRGELSITINRRVGSSVFQYEDRATILDLEAINDDLYDAGYDGLQSDDIIIIGDVNTLPGLIIRDGEIIPNIYPAVSFPDDHPGELGIGSNYITIALEMLDDVEIARLHTFRRV